MAAGDEVCVDLYGATTSGNWNNYSGTELTSMVRLSDGATTGISFNTTTGFEGAGSAGMSGWTGDFPDYFPDTAIDDYQYANSGGTGLFEWGGPDSDATYTIIISGTRNAGGPRVAKITIGAAFDSYDCAGNVDEYAIFTGVSPDGANEIHATMVSDSSNFHYLGVAVIIEEAAGGTYPLEIQEFNRIKNRQPILGM